MTWTPVHHRQMALMLKSSAAEKVEDEADPARHQGQARHRHPGGPGPPQGREVDPTMAVKKSSPSSDTGMPKM